jgi:hypothetical protein
MRTVLACGRIEKDAKLKVLVLLLTVLEAVPLSFIDALSY